MNDFYVYEHWRADKDIPFYVGKGRGKRAYLLTQRSDRHKKIVAKLKRNGFDTIVKIVFENLSEEEALEKEIALISSWRSKGMDLVNITKGGDGVSGLKHSDEARKRMSEIRKNNPNKYWLGKKLSQETLTKLSRVRKGRKHSEETRKKMSDAKKGKPPNNKTKPSLETRKKMSDSQKKIWKNRKLSTSQTPLP